MTKWVMTSRRQGRASGRDPGVAFYIGSVCVAEVLYCQGFREVLLSIDSDIPHQRFHSSVSSAMKEMHRLLQLPPPDSG